MASGSALIHPECSDYTDTDTENRNDAGAIVLDEPVAGIEPAVRQEPLPSAGRLLPRPAP